MPIRLSGLASGLDTDMLIKNIMDAERLKNKRVTDKKTTLEWQQDKWKELNAKLYKLYADDLSKLRMQGNYATKKASSSNENLLSVKAGANVSEGMHQVTIEALAKGKHIIGGEIKIDGGVKGSTKLVEDLEMKKGTIIKLTNGDKTQLIEVDDDTTLNSFINSAKSIGLNASLSDDRLFISSKTSGSKSDFSIETMSSSKETDVGKLLKAVEYDRLSTANKNKVSNAISALADENADRNGAIEVLKGFAEASVIRAIEKDVDASIRENVKKDINEDEIREEVTRREVELLKEAARKEGELTEDEIDEITVGDLDEKKLEAAQEAAIKNSVDKATAAAIKREKAKPKGESLYDQAIQADKETGGAGKIEGAAADIEAFAGTINKKDDLGLTTDLSVLSAMGLEEGTRSEQPADDAEITYNGAKFTSQSNVFTINGLTLNVKGATTGETITINVGNDTEATYNMIKDFVTSFNDILKEMNDLFYAPSSKGYDPLSDDEMGMMTDKQIEKWETTIQSSVLRRDSTLGSIMDVMKRTVMGSVDVGGKNFSLSSIGIGTSKDYTEKGLLHIKGDQDDPAFRDLPDVLMKMLEEDPDTVIEGFSKIAGNLYDAMADKMKSIPNVRSAFTFYNDKTMDKRIDQYTKDVSALEKKLKAVENKYYKQFAAMETAMSKLQSQSNALAGMLGMGN